MNIKEIWLLLFGFLSITIGFGQKTKDIVIGQEVLFHSDTLNQERTILIHLPRSYNDTLYSPKEYPVLFLLDAQEHFELTTGIVQFMSTRLDSKMIPEMIIVGIKSDNRISDYTPSYSTNDPDGVFVEAFKKSGQAEKFLNFIEFELIPKINEDYRTKHFTIFVGHSLGGLLTAYDFISTKSLFNGHIAIDPSLWWDNGLLTKTVHSTQYDFPQKSLKKMYISGAHNSSSLIDTTAMRIHQQEFYAAVKSKERMMSKVKYTIYEEEDHGTVPLPSLYKGLQFIFKNYRMADMLESSANEIQQHFKNISKNIGMELLPEERVIDILGNYFLEGTREVKKAISFFKLNTLNYPNSYHSYNALANAERENGKVSNAIMNYKKSLVLKPKNNAAEKDLIKLIQDTNDK